MSFHSAWDVVESLQTIKCHQIACKTFNNRNCFQEFYFVMADVLCILQSVTVHCRYLASYAMLYVPWRIWGLSPRREERFLCFSEYPACFSFNRLTPNDLYMSRTAPLTSKCCILYIYSTNVGTEYFKHALYSPFFSLQKCSLFHSANLFGSCIIHILYTGCAEIKKIIPAPKG